MWIRKKLETIEQCILQYCHETQNVAIYTLFKVILWLKKYRNKAILDFMEVWFPPKYKQLKDKLNFLMLFNNGIN